MKIVSLVKSVPDTQFDRHFNEYQVVDRSYSIISELDEYAVEQALIVAENINKKNNITIALTMGPKNAVNAIKKALHMGIDKGIHICDERLIGADAYTTAHVLAAAIRKNKADLVFTGMTSSDAEISVIPSMLSEILEWPQLSMVSSDFKIDNKEVQGLRTLENVDRTIETSLPSIISVTDQINKPRYPDFKSIIKAKNKIIQEITLDDLNLELSKISSMTKIESIVEKTIFRKKTIVKHEDDNAVIKLVDFLEAKNLL